MRAVALVELAVAVWELAGDGRWAVAAADPAVDKLAHGVDHGVALASSLKMQCAECHRKYHETLISKTQNTSADTGHCEDDYIYLIHTNNTPQNLYVHVAVLEFS